MPRIRLSSAPGCARDRRGSPGGAEIAARGPRFGSPTNAGIVPLVTEGDRRPVVILGAGLTGLSTALHLRRTPYLVAEREQRVGGKTRSERRDGYTFDVTGHWLHLRDPRVRALVGDLFGAGQLVEIERRTGVWTHGTMLPYPFQANLHGLPLPVVRDCLVAFVEAQVEAARPDAPAPRTFREFATRRFGRGIAELFFVPYNTKLWGVSPDELTPDWGSRFIPLPELHQVIGGALGLRQEGLGYNVRFLYPRAGGIDNLPEAMAARLRGRNPEAIRVGQAAEEIDAVGRRVKLQGQPEWIEYAALVSTMPLPQLVARIPLAPPAVREAAAALRWVSWRYLDVASRRAPPMQEHWVYVPEMHVPFFRVGVYTNALPAMAPPGAGSLYVELADRSGQPDMPEIVRHLCAMGALWDPEDVVFAELRHEECAYVLFDDACREATATIQGWLDRVGGIRSTGRYGAWTYNSMEDSIIQGMEAAAWAEA
jgi:protoporphyrinogen oxidase